MADAILVLNAGSSSLKFSVFLHGETPEPLLRGQLEGLFTQPHFVARDRAGRSRFSVTAKGRASQAARRVGLRERGRRARINHLLGCYRQRVTRSVFGLALRQRRTHEQGRIEVGRLHRWQRQRRCARLAAAYVVTIGREARATEGLSRRREGTKGGGGRARTEASH